MQELEAPGKNAGTVVKATIALGRELDMRISVEGGETAQQAAFLDEINAVQVQGYFFGGPMPATEIGGEILRSVLRSLPTEHARRGVSLAQDGFCRSGPVILD
jgi:EAL domain-containing protein (putative c-di-GMP-specific phosphodiesterase class I)